MISSIIHPDFRPPSYLMMTRSALPYILLTLLLLAGQWAYAEHNAETWGDEHHQHASECVVCNYQATADGAISTAFAPTDSTPYSHPLSQSTSQPSLGRQQTYCIRAPPTAL